MVPMILANGKLELWSRHIIKKQKNKTTKHGHTYKHVFIYFVVIAILNDVTAIFAKSINKQTLGSYNNNSKVSLNNNYNYDSSEHDIGKIKNDTQYFNRNYFNSLGTVTARNEFTRQNNSTPKNPFSSFSGKHNSLTHSSFNKLLLTEKNFSNTLDTYNNKINFDPVPPNFDYNEFGFNDNTLPNNFPLSPPSSTLSNRRSSLPKVASDQNVQLSAWLNISTYFGNDTANSTDGSNFTEYNGEEPLSDVILMGVMSVILGILILITVIGNVFVIAAILLERNLQNVANYLIVSLAVADLMVACLVMPLGAVYEISRGWILGPELCDMWTSSDVLCCTASILHLVAIAVDRYWAVTNVDYIHTRNAGRIISMIVVIWSVAIVVSLAPQFGWKDPDYLDRINIQQRCLVSQDVGYQIFATCSTFYVPLLVILVLYWKIFQTARKRIRRRRAQRNAVLHGSKEKASGNKQNNTENKRLNFLKKKKFLRIRKSKGDKSLSKEGVSSSLVLVEGQSTCSTIEIVDEDSGNRRESNCEHEIGESTNVEQTTAFTISSNHAVTPTNLSPEKSSGATATTNNGSTSHQSDKTFAQQTLKDTPATSTLQQQQQQQQKLHQQQQHHQKQGLNHQATKRDTKKESIEAKREKKAAKTLAIITGAFVVCWLPFFIMALLMPLCESCYINNYLASFFLWLGYFNSTLNPVIYTIFSPEFRQAFKRILCGVSSARNRGRKLR